MNVFDIDPPGASRMFRIVLAAVCTCALLFGTIRTSHAQPRDPFEGLTPDQEEQVVELMDRAALAEDEGRWTDAIEIYEQLWEIVPAEEFEFRRAVCLEQLRFYDQAMEIYMRLANSDRPEISVLAEERIQVVALQRSRRPTTLMIETHVAGAVVLLDDEEIGTTTQEGLTVEVPAGEHMLTIEHEDYYPYEDELLLSPGSQVHYQADLVALPGVVTDTGQGSGQGDGGGEGDGGGGEVERGGPGLVLPVVFGVAAVAAGGTGIAFGLAANSKADEERNFDRHSPGATRADVETLANEADDKALIANISFAAAGAFAVTSAILFILHATSGDDGGGGDGGTDEAASGVAFEPVFSPDGGGAVLRIEF